MNSGHEGELNQIIHFQKIESGLKIWVIRMDSEAIPD
jgi:hypothetical protein